jgi:hypothetical protein
MDGVAPQSHSPIGVTRGHQNQALRKPSALQPPPKTTTDVTTPGLGWLRWRLLRGLLRGDSAKRLAVDQKYFDPWLARTPT